MIGGELLQLIEILGSGIQIHREVGGIMMGVLVHSLLGNNLYKLVLQDIMLYYGTKEMHVFFGDLMKMEI